MIRRINKKYPNKYQRIYEDTEEDNEVEVDIHTPEYINQALKDIAKDNGYIYKENSITTLGSGQICISKNVYIYLKYNKTLSDISVKVIKNMFKCLDTTKEIDDLSMDLQIAQMVIDTIRTKLI